MKTETLERARTVDEKYFGNIPLGRSVAVMATQIASMEKEPTVSNIRRQAGDALFGLISLCRNQDWDPDEVLAEATTKIENRRKERHYYEAHVTVEPVFQERLEEFRRVCGLFGFHVATLLMQKRLEDTATRSANDSFCTGRSISLTDIETRMFAVVDALVKAGFKVWRYKIESTLMDSRYDDSRFPLERDALPEKEKSPKAPAPGALAGRIEEAV